jgi:3-oxoacyl-[acyl-carrier-protein] synthase III
VRIRDVFVQALGSYLPPAVSAGRAVEQGWYDPANLELHYLTGTLVAGDVPPARMAVEAARTTLDRAGRKSTELDSLIHASVFQPGPAGWSLPGYALNELGGGTASVTDLRQGCTGMLMGVEIAVGQITGAQRHGTVLLTAADNFGKVLDRWRCRAFIAGDAGSAALLSGTSGFARIVSLNSRTIPELEGMHRGDEDLTADGDGRQVDLAERLTQFDKDVPIMDAADLMAKTYTELARASVADAGLELEQVTRVLYNHVSVFLTKQLVLDPLGFELRRSTWHFGRGVGHLGASDFVVSLEHLLLEGALAPGDHVLLIGGSPGYFISSAVLEILEVPAWARR